MYDLEMSDLEPISTENQKITITRAIKKNEQILTFMMGMVRRPHAKNSKNITTSA